VIGLSWAALDHAVPSSRNAGDVQVRRRGVRQDHFMAVLRVVEEVINPLFLHQPGWRNRNRFRGIGRSTPWVRSDREADSRSQSLRTLL
jgi:hypothetical protein